ncbi:MAG: glycosyltransferase family 4 protein [Planctomycetota bacterium]
MRVAICTNFVSPYRRPVFQEIARHPGVELSVFTSTGVEGDRGWAAINGDGEAFNVVRCSSVTRRRAVNSIGGGGFTQQVERHYPVGLPIELARFGPDVIISGELGPRTILAWMTGRAMGKPVIPWTYHPEAQADVAGRGVIFRRRFLKACPAVIGMGSQARRVLRSMGCDDNKIFDAPNAADMSTIDARMSSPEHRSAVAAIRARFPGKRIALVAGRLVPMKGIEQLLSAWQGLDEQTRDAWELVFVGHGPLANAVDQAKAFGVSGVGHVDPSELPDWYVASAIHVFASLGDPWGLVVNEAMRCGVPTLCSKLAGCADDLVRDEHNGLVFNPAAPTAEVTSDLRRALNHDSLSRLGSNASEDVSGLTPAFMARSMLKAVEDVTNANAQRKGAA